MSSVLDKISAIITEAAGPQHPESWSEYDYRIQDEARIAADEIESLTAEGAVMLKIMKKIWASDDIVEIGCLADEAIERVSGSHDPSAVDVTGIINIPEGTPDGSLLEISLATDDSRLAIDNTHADAYACPTCGQITAENAAEKEL